MGILAVDPAAEGLLRHMLQAERSLRIEGTQITSIDHEGRQVTSEQHIVRNGTKGMRTDYLKPPRMVGELIVDNGKKWWHYIPLKNRLETAPSRLGRLQGHLQEALRHLQQNRNSTTISISGSEKIAGHDCQIIDVRQRTEQGMRLRRFWVDPANGAQLRIDQYDPSGQIRSSTSYTNVIYNPTIDNKVFAPPVTPKNVRIVARDEDKNFRNLAEIQEHAGFRIAQPAYLPPGYAFQSGGLTEFREQKMVVLRYSNGVSVLSLFQSPASEGEEGEPVKHPRSDVAFAHRAGRRLILVGTIGSAEADKILQSVR